MHGKKKLYDFFMNLVTVSIFNPKKEEEEEEIVN